MTTKIDSFMETVKGNLYQWRDCPTSLPFRIVGYIGFPYCYINTVSYGSNNSSSFHFKKKDNLVKVSLEEAERIFQVYEKDHISKQEAERIFRIHQEAHNSSQSLPKETEQYATPTQAVKALRREMGEEPGLAFVDSLTPEEAVITQHGYSMTEEGDDFFYNPLITTFPRKSFVQSLL